MGNTINITNAQFGDGNVMINNMHEAEWEKIQEFLEARVDELQSMERLSNVAKEALEYVKKRDEKGLKGFIERNKESVITNIFSTVASSELMQVLDKLFL